MAGGTKMPPLAGKRQQIFVFAGTILYPGKSIMKDTAVKILVYNLFYMRP